MRHAVKRCGSIIPIVALILGLWMATGIPVSADVTGEQLIVSVAPERISTSVGTAAEVTVTVVNMAAEPTPELAIHLDITDPRASTSVDPEDWTPTLTRSTPALGPGERVTQSWTITPIGPGDFVLYAVALDTNSSLEPATLAVSNGVPVHVDEKRSFNPQGVLPLSIAMPVVIGMALLWRHRRRRV